VELKKAHARDKNFYEEALETRMNQIEELEQQVEQLNLKSNTATPNEIDHSAQLRVENKRLQNLNGELKRELQIE
jgi:ABC-type phosphate transport system auxiliary subunit